MRTRWKFLLALALMIQVACCAVPRSVDVRMQGHEDNFAWAQTYTYHVDSGLGTGSAWPWDQNTFITNWHVVMGEPEETFVSGAGRAWTVVSVERLPGVDAALLHVRGPELQVPERRALPPVGGEFVTLSGFPTPSLCVTYGWVSGRWYFTLWAVDGTIIPGMSGGPVLDAEGLVIGMNVAYTVEPSRPMALFISIGQIEAGIRRAERQREQAEDEPTPLPDGFLPFIEVE